MNVPGWWLIGLAFAIAVGGAFAGPIGMLVVGIIVLLLGRDWNSSNR